MNSPSLPESADRLRGDDLVLAMRIAAIQSIDPATATFVVARERRRAAARQTLAEKAARVHAKVTARIAKRVASLPERRRGAILALELSGLERLHSEGRLSDAEARDASAAARDFWG